MLIFDQLKKNDPQLRLLAVAVAAGMVALLSGLWWVQVVSARAYQASLETQSYRSVRIPAIRGKILDRNGVVLAENAPTYNVNLYLEELRGEFKKEYRRIRPQEWVTNSPVFWQRWLGAKQVQLKDVRLSRKEEIVLQEHARFNVVSNTVQEVSRHLGIPLTLDYNHFRKHYDQRLALPYPIARKIGTRELARFHEQGTGGIGLDLEVLSTRVYPHQTTAAHLIGQVGFDNDSMAGEEAYFTYRLPDYRGKVGIEYAFDAELHGRAGAKSVLVNSLGYRQAENIWTPAEAGGNVILALDIHIQQATERALQTALVGYGIPRGAAVVMDVRTGDVLAMASSPTFDPNLFAQGLTDEEYRRIQAESAEKNRATQENYQPGSIIKPIVALAALERGLNEHALYEVLPHPYKSGYGAYFFSAQEYIEDQASPGHYDFERALIKSSNSYFIACGLNNLPKILEIASELQLGQPVLRLSGVTNRQETAGNFPTPSRVRSGWRGGDTAQICIGQGPVDVTPLQMAVVASTIANGGHVLSPRLVQRVEPQDPLSGKEVEKFPPGQVRNRLSVSQRTLGILKRAMLADTEKPDGTAYEAFRNWPNARAMRVCGKTGTAQKKNVRNQLEMHITWFLSFAPYENPRYAVVVMVEGGLAGGGGTCAPIARKIYDGILQREQMSAAHPEGLARTN